MMRRRARRRRSGSGGGVMLNAILASDFALLLVWTVHGRSLNWDGMLPRGGKHSGM